jgi:AraC-like DNA-binding protein
MSPVEKALWYIEGHLGLDISLADIAAGACVSRHHLLRAFAAATGLSVMRYVRGRRLSEAAQRLAGGAGDILSVAIDAGYNSHEAFTRAFGDQFGMRAAWTTCAASKSAASAHKRRSSRACGSRDADTQYSCIASTSPVFAGPGTRSGTAGCRAPATTSRMHRSSNAMTTTFTRAAAVAASRC